jgi:hypothetical protein
MQEYYALGVRACHPVTRRITILGDISFRSPSEGKTTKRPQWHTPRLNS